MKSIGIDPGDHAVKVVELDGSYKKTRLTQLHVLVAGAGDGAARAAVAATAAREAVDAGMRGELTLGHPCREAVLRTIELPFKGHDAIRKVVKAEIEGEIQSQSVDDMVVDFHEIGDGLAGGTRVLVASVPKAGLRLQLAAMTAEKLEPERIDLDTMALWRVAHWAGAFAKVADGAAQAVTAVVDIGARSVKVILVDGERLVEMRALRLGDAAVAEEMARKHGLDLRTARDAVQACLSSGTDHKFEVAAALPAPAEGGAAEAPAVPVAPARQVTLRHAEVASAHEAWLQRLSRELTRFLAASGRGDHLRAVWATGGSVRSAGVAEMLAKVFGAEVHELDVLGNLQHDLTPEQVAEYGSRLATAVGLALSPLGGPAGFELRQEDLVLTRGFERLKFPLAITCMVALLALFVHGNRKVVELSHLEYELGQTYVNKKDPKAPTIFFGQLNQIFASNWFANPEHFQLEVSKGKFYNHKDLVAELVATDVHKRMQLVRDKLRAVSAQKQKASGIFEDVTLESGLAVLVRWSEMMKAAESQLGRYLVVEINLNMKSPNRQLEFWVAFRGSDFRRPWAALQQAIETELQRPDTPFAPAEKTDSRRDEELFKDSAASGVDGAYYRFTLNIKDAFQPFGGALGLAEPPRRDGDRNALAEAK